MEPKGSGSVAKSKSPYIVTRARRARPGVDNVVTTLRTDPEHMHCLQDTYLAYDSTAPLRHESEKILDCTEFNSTTSKLSSFITKLWLKAVMCLDEQARLRLVSTTCQL